MPRTPPGTAPSIPALIRRREPLLSVELAVVTPMFGGGAVPRQADPDLPIRGASIRGHLRFWWRACMARHYATVDELFAAEAQIWGKAAGDRADGPSDVDVAVEILDAGRENQTLARERNTPLAYALFPFQENRRQGNPAAIAREGARFRLGVFPAAHVTGDEQRATLLRHVEAAVWAWVMFGGVGARTRRGCGSLLCCSNDSRFRPGADPLRWLREGYGRHVLRGSGCPMVPALFAALAVGPRPMPPVQAWAQAVDAMRQFRQGVGVGRQPSAGGRQGKSHWPEAASIRALADRQQRGSAGVAPYFPRADFGLPIIFQQMQLGPSDPTLQAAEENATRMASPIILKPLVLSAERAHPMAVLLDTPRLGSARAPRVELAGPGAHILAGHELHDPARNAAIPPIAATGKADVRSAFMDFAQDFWSRRAGGRR